MTARFAGQVAEDTDPVERHPDEERTDDERAADYAQFHAAAKVAQAAHDAASDAEAVRVATALIPVGMRFRNKDELYVFLAVQARRQSGQSLDLSARNQLWRASILLWATGDVHELPPLTLHSVRRMVLAAIPEARVPTLAEERAVRRAGRNSA